MPGVFNSIAAKTPTKNGIKIRKNGIVLNTDILIKVIKKSRLEKLNGIFINKKL